MGDHDNGLSNVPWTNPAMQPPGPSGESQATGGYTPDAVGPNGIQDSPWSSPPVPLGAGSGRGTPTSELAQPSPGTMSIDGLGEGASFDKDITSWNNTVDKK